MSDPEKWSHLTVGMENLCYILPINLYIRGSTSKIAICAKTILIISFDFPEIIFMSFHSVHLAAISTESCIRETSFTSHISVNVLSSTYLYTKEQPFLNHLCKQGTFRSTQCSLRNSSIGMISMGIDISYFYSLSNRNVAIHLAICEGKPYICSFSSNKL